MVLRTSGACRAEARAPVASGGFPDGADESSDVSGNLPAPSDEFPDVSDESSDTSGKSSDASGNLPDGADEFPDGADESSDGAANSSDTSGNSPDASGNAQTRAAGAMRRAAGALRRAAGAMRRAAALPGTMSDGPRGRGPSRGGAARLGAGLSERCAAARFFPTAVNPPGGRDDAPAWSAIGQRAKREATSEKSGGASTARPGLLMSHASRLTPPAYPPALPMRSASGRVMARGSRAASSALSSSTFFSRATWRTVLPVLNDSLAMAAASS